MNRMDNRSFLSEVDEAADYIKARLDGRVPDMALILGSGLGELAEEVEAPVIIPYSEAPGFPVSTVAGHAGRFVAGKLEGRYVIVMQGRIHYYEGYSMRRTAFPIFVMKRLGIRSAVVTNAAGGMNRSFRPGDLMLIRDHLNLTGDNPLIGPNEDALGPRFPDLTDAYDPAFRRMAEAAAVKASLPDDPIRLVEGVYCGISGPSYMTPAELTMLASVGGDAVGMSTVGEVIAARYCGIRVLGISCITDMAIGDELEPLTHEQVMAVAEQTKPRFIRVVKGFLREAAAQ